MFSDTTSRVYTALGKQGRWLTKFIVRENTGNFGNFVKSQGILFAHVVNSLIQKVKDIGRIPGYF